MTRAVPRRATLAEIFALRHAELRPGLPEETARFAADDEPGARHFGAFLPEGACVGCASFVPRPWQGAPALQLRGMATRADLVRTGVGRALLRFAEEELAAERGARPLLWCNARVGAVGFYERLGWTVVSDVFDVPTVGPHRAMLRR